MKGGETRRRRATRGTGAPLDRRWPESSVRAAAGILPEDAAVAKRAFAHGSAPRLA